MKTVSCLSIPLLKANPSNIYVFGDNLIKRGKGGQAVIRGCTNAFGIPTKRLPARTPNAYFSDKENEFIAVDKALDDLMKYKIQGRTIIFPSQGLGTGLAQMATKSPKLFKHLNDLLNTHFN